MNDNWISLKDKMPDYDTPVLLAEAGHVYDKVYRRTKYLCGGECWDIDDSDGEGKLDINYPEYWQLLPSPPKGDNHE